MTLLKEACTKVTKEDWRKVVEKTKKLIKEDFDRDVNIDNIIENELIIWADETSTTDGFGSSSDDVNK